MYAGRAAAFLAFLGAFAGAFFLGTTTELAREDADAFMEEFEGLVDGIDAWGIFAHNAAIALPMFVPGLGAAWGAFSAWSTGAAFSAIATANPEAAAIEPLSVLFLTPFGLMEAAAYSLGMSRSFILARAAVRRSGLGRHAAPTLAEIGAALLLLLAGAHAEFHAIARAA